MSQSYAGSKRKARAAARRRRLSDAFQKRMERLNALAQQIESEAELDVMLEREVPDLEARAAVKSLVMALREQAGPRIELATGPEDIRRIVQQPAGNRAAFIPTPGGRAMGLILES